MKQLFKFFTHAQGLDAFGLATVDSLSNTAASRLLFSASFRSSLLDDEDIQNLRTLRRLLLLISQIQNNGSAPAVSNLI